MKAVRFDFADASFPASLVEVDEPTLPTAEWARVAVTVGGICGSDLHLFAPASEGSPTLRGIAEFPFELGHEIAGTIIEVATTAPSRSGPGWPWIRLFPACPGALILVVPTAPKDGLPVVSTSTAT